MDMVVEGMYIVNNSLRPLRTARSRVFGGGLVERRACLLQGPVSVGRENDYAKNVRAWNRNKLPSTATECISEVTTFDAFPERTDIKEERIYLRQ